MEGGVLKMGRWASLTVTWGEMAGVWARGDSWRDDGIWSKSVYF